MPRIRTAPPKSFTEIVLKALYPTKRDIKNSITDIVTDNKISLGIRISTPTYLIHENQRYYCSATISHISQGYNCILLLEKNKVKITELTNQLTALTKEKEKLHRYFITTINEYSEYFLYTYILPQNLKTIFKPLTPDITAPVIVTKHKEANKEIIKLLNKRVIINLLLNK